MCTDGVISRPVPDGHPSHPNTTVAGHANSAVPTYYHVASPILSPPTQLAQLPLQIPVPLPINALVNTNNRQEKKRKRSPGKGTLGWKSPRLRLLLVKVFNNSCFVRTCFHKLRLHFNDVDPLFPRRLPHCHRRRPSRYRTLYWCKMSHQL